MSTSISETITLNNKLNNVNVKNIKPQTKTLGEVRSIVIRLTQQLHDTNPNNEPFYYKAAWTLPEAKLWYYLEQALTGRSPAKYFAWLCKNAS